MTQAELNTVKRHYGNTAQVDTVNPDGSLLVRVNDGYQKMSKRDLDFLTKREGYSQAEDKESHTRKAVDGLDHFSRKGIDAGIIAENPTIAARGKVEQHNVWASEGMFGGEPQGLPSERPDAPRHGLPSRHTRPAKPAGLPSQRR